MACCIESVNKNNPEIIIKYLKNINQIFKYSLLQENSLFSRNLLNYKILFLIEEIKKIYKTALIFFNIWFIWLKILLIL